MNHFFFLFFCCAVFCYFATSGHLGPSSGLPATIAIGGIFAPHELEELLVFYAAIEKIKLNFNESTTFIPIVEFVENANSFMANRKTCELLRIANPVALIGPLDPLSSLQVQSICEHLEIPHLEQIQMIDFKRRTDLTLNLHPHSTILSRVFMDLIDALEWTTFAVIYENSESIVHFREFFLKKKENMKEDYDIRLYQLQPDVPYRDILWKLKEAKIKNILLDVDTRHIGEVLRHALQVGILTQHHNYLITSLDFHTLADLANYRHSFANLTSLRIVNEDHPLLRSLLVDWADYSNQYLGPFGRSLQPPVHLKSQSAMIFDAITLFAQALVDLKHFEMPNVSCHTGIPWKWGTTLVNWSRQMTLEGLTGFVEIDSTGFRSKLQFDVISTTENDFEIIGAWKQGKGLKKTEQWKKHSKSKDLLDLIRVTTVLNDPFVMNTNNSKELKGNDRYEGYVVDLMKEIAELMNFRFEINLVKDGQYGGMINETANEWDGMIGEVLRGEADLAVADLTINSNRELAVDFTYPFMATGISIIYKTPTTETSFWSFLSPFSPTVWLYLLSAFLGISLALFYVGRFTPYEWVDRHPCHHHASSLENACSLRNSFWCTLGSLMQQGSDVTPKALSTRIICAIWYFFTLIVVSSYTANLAAFLTVENTQFPFETVEELAGQNKITYGCMANGATHKFFANSNIRIYKKMAAFMEANPSLLMPSNAKGRETVEKEDGKYAFFMESATIEYITERYCTLAQVGGLLDHKGYGVAIKKGAKLRNPLSETILKLQETGVLQQLKDRWWKQKGGGQCIAKPPPELIKLSLQNLGGVFVVLVAGTLIAIAIGICEFLLKTRSGEKKTYKTQLLDELTFAFSCWKPTKVLNVK